MNGSSSRIGNERCFEHNLNFGSDGEKIEFELYLPIKKKLNP